jgi:hypothetical protein
MNLTRSLSFQDNSWYRWHLGGVDVFVRRCGSLWQSFYRQIPWTESAVEYSGPAQEEPEGGGAVLDAANSGAVNNAAWNGKTATLQVSFPEKPFLLNLGGVKLHPGTELFLELQLPPAFHLLPGKGACNSEQSEILFTYNLFFLKDAWFGRDTMRGNLYASLPASVKAPPNAPLGIHCALHIRNHLKTALDLNKVPLYTDTLAIYEKDGAFISDKPVIDVYGDGDDFRETIIKEQGVLLAPPVNKNGTSESFIRKGTRMIKKIARYK